jgi:hypothetical protein
LPDLLFLSSDTITFAFCEAILYITQGILNHNFADYESIGGVKRPLEFDQAENE